MKTLKVTATETGVRLSLFLFERPIQILVQKEDAEKVYRAWREVFDWDNMEESSDALEIDSNKTGFLLGIRLGDVRAIGIEP